MSQIHKPWPFGRMFSITWDDDRSIPSVPRSQTVCLFLDWKPFDMKNKFTVAGDDRVVISVLAVSGSVVTLETDWTPFHAWLNSGLYDNSLDLIVFYNKLLIYGSMSVMR